MSWADGASIHLHLNGASSSLIIKYSTKTFSLRFAKRKLISHRSIVLQSFCCVSPVVVVLVVSHIFPPARQITYKKSGKCEKNFIVISFISSFQLRSNLQLVYRDFQQIFFTSSPSLECSFLYSVFISFSSVETIWWSFVCYEVFGGVKNRGIVQASNGETSVKFFENKFRIQWKLKTINSKHKGSRIIPPTDSLRRTFTVTKFQRGKIREILKISCEVEIVKLKCSFKIPLM